MHVHTKLGLHYLLYFVPYHHICLLSSMEQQIVCYKFQGRGNDQTQTREPLLPLVYLFPSLGFPFMLQLSQHMFTEGQGQTPAGSDPVLDKRCLTHHAASFSASHLTLTAYTNMLPAAQRHKICRDQTNMPRR